jgi:hypothetical protein
MKNYAPARDGCYGVGAQERESIDLFCIFSAERRIMLGETQQLKQKLEEILTSDNPEWINAMIVTLNAMYTQFDLERQGRKQIIPIGARRKFQPQIGLVTNWRSHDRTLVVFVLITL